MENQPKELSLEEIRKFMLQNNCKVTNHALVKHFRSFLTNKDTQDDARKQFKTYVNVLASIKHEGNEKYLVLRRKFYDDIPSEDSLNMTVSQPMSPASRSYGIVPSDGEASPMRLPPPYRPPPVVSPDAVSYQGSPRGSVALNRRNSSEIARSGSEISIGSEFASVDVKKVNPLLVRSNSSDTRQTHDVGRRQSADVYKFDEAAPPAIPPRKRISESGSNSVSNSRQNSVEEKLPVPGVEGPGENKENVPATDTDETGAVATEENKLSVKEKMMKFNRFASEEEAKIPSPIGKKKPEKNPEETINAENLLQHPNAKEWLIAAAKSDYQLLAKLASEHPTLVKLQDISTGYTALHWAAKHGNEDVIKLVAGKLKADVNARTNGGYTALHIATQFGRNDIFELLCNVYKADRDLLDWSGKKPLEYQKQLTSVSASTYSSEYERKLSKHEKFFTLPSKTLSPLTRGGTFMRRKRRQRPSTTDHVTLQTFVESFPSLPGDAPTPRAPQGLAADSNNNSPNNSSSSITRNNTAPTKHSASPNASPGELNWRNRSHQCFFRKKRTATNIV